MKIFNYIFVSDVLSRLILFLACFLLFARDGKQNTNYDSTENTKTNGTTIGPKQRAGSMNCFCPNLFQANMFQSIIFIMVWKVGAMLSLCYGTNLGQNVTKLGQHDVKQTPDCSSALVTLSNIKTSWE